MIPLLTQEEYNFIKESNEIESEVGVDFDHLNAFVAVKCRYELYGFNTIDEKFVLKLHTKLMLNKLRRHVGVYRETPVGIYQGNTLIKQMPNPAIVPTLMDEWIVRFNEMKLTPWELHKEFENVHPFIDGNGRSGRLLWAFDLLRRGERVEPILNSFYNEKEVDTNENRWYSARENYYKALN